MDTRLFMKLLFLTLFSFCLWGSSPIAFSHLGQAIEVERPLFIALLENETFSKYKDEVDGYLLDVDKAFEIGYALDLEVASLEGENEK